MDFTKIYDYILNKYNLTKEETEIITVYSYSFSYSFFIFDLIKEANKVIIENGRKIIREEFSTTVIEKDYIGIDDSYNDICFLIEDTDNIDQENFLEIKSQLKVKIDIKKFFMIMSEVCYLAIEGFNRTNQVGKYSKEEALILYKFLSENIDKFLFDNCTLHD